MGISVASNAAVLPNDGKTAARLRIAVCGADTCDLVRELSGFETVCVDALTTDEFSDVDPLSYDMLAVTDGPVPDFGSVAGLPLVLDLRGTGSLAAPGATQIDLAAIVSLAAQSKARFDTQQGDIQRLRMALADVREAHASIDGDLVEAKKLQQSLLRERGVTLGQAEMALFLQSSGHVGGDLVGHFPIDRRRIGFFAIDVSGHGITSALMAARLAGYLSAGSPQANIALTQGPNGPQPRDPATVVAEFNALVLEELETEHYFTLLLGHMDTQTGRVAASQAGHPHPILIRSDGTQRNLGSGGLPVGLIPGADYETFTIDMAVGDRLVILSDGFIEAELPDGSLLGEDGLAHLLGETRSLPLPRILDTLVWRLSQICGDTGFADDLSGVVISYDSD